MAPVSSRKKQKKKRIVGSDDESGSDLDLDKPLFTLNHYIKDRPSMLSQAFDVVGAQKIRSMLPPALKSLSPEDLESACLDQLLGMSDRRIQQVLNGTSTADVSSSETSEDEEPPKAEPETGSKSNGEGNPSQPETLAVVDAKDDDGNESSDGDTLQIGITSKEMDEVLEKPQVVPETQGKTLLEILELEMRARAIRALLKQNNAPAASKGADAAKPEVGADAESEAKGQPKAETPEEKADGVPKEKSDKRKKRKSDKTKNENDETEEEKSDEAKTKISDETKKEESEETKEEETGEAKKQASDKTKKEVKNSPSTKKRCHAVESDDEDVVFVSETVAPEKVGKPAKSEKIKEKAPETNLKPVYNPTTDILEFKQVPSKSVEKASIVVVKPIKPRQGSKKFKVVKLQENKAESSKKAKTNSSNAKTVTADEDASKSVAKSKTAKN